MLLPLNDFQGEVSGFAETNVLQNQLQTGQIEMPTLLNAVHDSGAIEVTLEENNEGDDFTLDGQGSYNQDLMYSSTRRHQGTQTNYLCFNLLVLGPTSHWREMRKIQ